MIPQEKLGVVILSNRSYKNIPLPRLLMNKIFDMYVGASGQDWSTNNLTYLAYEKNLNEESRALEEVDDKRVRGTKPLLIVAKLRGRYVNRMYGDVILSERKGKLTLRLLPSPSIVGELTHLDDDTFRVQWRDPVLPSGFVTFVQDATRAINQIKIDIPNADLNISPLTFERVSRKF